MTAVVSSVMSLETASTASSFQGNSQFLQMLFDKYGNNDDVIYRTKPSNDGSQESASWPFRGAIAVTGSGTGRRRRRRTRHIRSMITEMMSSKARFFNIIRLKLRTLVAQQRMVHYVLAIGEGGDKGDWMVPKVSAVTQH